MSLRKPREEVGEGGPCVSVLLFRGGGGGGKMAAHGGSAASSALKGLIQQFTAITAPVLPPEERRRRRRVSGFRRKTAPPCTPCPLWRETPSALVSPDPENGPIPSAPAGPGTWGRERWGAAPGPPPSFSFIILSSLCSVGVQCIPSSLFPFFLGQVILPRSLASPSPFWAPRSHRRGPGVLGPSRLNSEDDGLASFFTDPGR
ncbi:hypothetical protein MC885_010197 [Smutsia gigantea]|nr:hypothetical protein MC885_010197 [Smutsia gigantea]